LGVLVTALLLALHGSGAADPEAALAAGNRLFEKDEIEAALRAYSGGYAAGTSPEDGVLAYNAGTCALRLGRLPEALLWFRRAEAEAAGDPWLRDNLILTRRSLGDLAAEDPGWAVWLQGRHGFTVAGVVLAWTVLGLLVLAPRLSRLSLAALALAACAAFATGWLLERSGPRPAVLLAACPEPRSGLPAGSEVWARPAKDGAWHVLGDGRRLLCPAPAVGLVKP
jgi:hypothetical protein